MAVKYSVSVKCANCNWKGNLQFDFGSYVQIDGNGRIQGALCSNCGCANCIYRDAQP